LLASAKAFLAFFALPSADFCDFSAFALAAAATLYAFCEALSSAPSDAIRVLAVARAATMKEERKSSKETQQRISIKKNDWMSNAPSEAFATFTYPAHSVPKATNFFNNAWKKGHVRAQVCIEKTSQ
jgi:hypothetical protein